MKLYVHESGICSEDEGATPWNTVHCATSTFHGRSEDDLQKKNSLEFSLKDDLYNKRQQLLIIFFSIVLLK
jgi:hypothetical protein